MIVTESFDLSTLKGTKKYSIFKKGDAYRIAMTNMRVWLEHYTDVVNPEHKRHYNFCLEKLKEFAIEEDVRLYPKDDKGLVSYQVDIEILEHLDTQGIKD